MDKEFVNMVNANRGIIYKVCNLYFSEEEDKRDLFQEIVLQLWKSYPSFAKMSLLSTWIYRVALNTAISSFRRAKVKPSCKPISVLEFDIPDLVQSAKQNERLHLLMDAIQHLSKVEKAVILLYLEEKSYEEMSDIMGVSKTNIGTKINRIKTKLETIIKSVRDESR
ncbi:MAG: sigma-70 family RNA polymerase sigma factor [Chitinophagaceae bacterium]|nr:sigma-70 family RNA polymerase sigma factor [Chitinophagaceae bacterium]